MHSFVVLEPGRGGGGGSRCHPCIQADGRISIPKGPLRASASLLGYPPRYDIQPFSRAPAPTKVNTNRLAVSVVKNNCFRSLLLLVPDAASSTHLLLFLTVLNRQRLVCVAQEVLAVLRACLAGVPAGAQPGGFSLSSKRQMLALIGSNLVQAECRVLYFSVNLDSAVFSQASLGSEQRFREVF